MTQIPDAATLIARTKRARAWTPASIGSLKWIMYASPKPRKSA